MIRIFLTGYMGAGKTTLGKAFARELNVPFIDLDWYIEERFHKSIRELFVERGEASFRELERNMLHEVSEFEDVIISTGGGTPCFFDNMDYMNGHGQTVFLDVHPDILFNRLRVATHQRPILQGKTDEELRKLREHGLALVYIGLESGNEELLLKFNKGVTAAETVKNALRCKAAGIAISVTAINGMAGLNGDWQAHAIDTAKAVSAMKPEFIAFLTLRVYSGTPLHDRIEAGEFQMMGPADLMRETRLFLEHIDSEGSVFRSNHASNYLPLGGTLNRDREALIQTIDAALDGKVRLRRAVELGL